MEKMVDSSENFLRFLEAKGLSEKTKHLYLYYYENFKHLIEKAGGLSQDLVNGFISHYKSSSISRAFIKNYLMFIGNKELEVYKTKARKKIRRINTISPQEVGGLVSWLFQNSTDDKFGLMVLLAYSCGLRKSEVVNIRLNDFDLQKWQESPNLGVRLKIKGKGDKERIVIVPNYLMTILKPYLLKRIDEFKDNDETLFNIGADRLNQKFRRACKEVLDKHYKFHELRHSRTLEWYKEGKDIYRIKNRLGHSSIATTQLYINPEVEDEISEWSKEGGKEN